MDEPITSVEEFIAWTKRLDVRMLLYRGLADADWRVESSASRRLTVSSEDPPPVNFQNYIRQLLDNASLHGFRYQRDRELSDLELLAELQHFGAATCLIDFTENGLIALWFACQEKPNTNGKVAALATDNPDRFFTVTYDHLRRPIMEFLNKGELWQWTPSGMNNRIVAQQSVFVFGEGAIQESLYEEIEVDAESKRSITSTLEKSLGVKEQRIFSDLAGFARNNAHDRAYGDFTAEDYFYWGFKFQQQGQFEKAMEYYGKSIALDPRSIVAYDNRGSVKSALGDHKAAIADFNKAIEIYPQSGVAYYNRGNSHSALGDHKAAIADFDRAIEINPHSDDAYCNRGNAKIVSGDHQGAIADYDKAIEIKPHSEQAFNNRGNARYSLGDHSGALADFDKVIEINPRSVQAYYNRGNVKLALGDYQGAISDYDKSLEIGPRRGIFKSCG